MTAWVFRGDGGVWSRPIETMDTPIELWPDEIADFPPLVEAKGEADQYRRVAAQLARWCAGIVAGARSVEAARIAAYEAEVKAIVAVARRRRLAAFEASDPAGRLAEMDARHRAEAARLRAEYPEADR